MLTRLQVKERARNKLKDYITMAPALKVTHLLAFTLTEIAPSMRIVRLSNGPTLSFRVERYSLIKDIKAASRHAKNMGTVEYISPPLVRLYNYILFLQIFSCCYSNSSFLHLSLSQDPVHRPIFRLL
jgi:ribosome biogenesis protein SSF1/2